MTPGQRFARLVTDVVVRAPALWRLLRRPLRRQFERLAPVWDEGRDPAGLAALERSLDELAAPPARALDLGTGTGAAAALVASRFPEAEVVGVDVAPAMVARARAKYPALRFEVADASALPFEDGAFDLVVLANMIPFFDELARVAAADGTVVFAFSRGDRTPIWVDAARIRAELSRRGFTAFAEHAAGAATAIAARRG